jgi:hypothetical protein
MSVENNIEAISNTLRDIDEAYKDYVPLVEAYNDSMKKSGTYEPVPDYTPKEDEVFTGDQICAGIVSGEITDKNMINRAVTAGKIRVVKIAKPEKLVNAEKVLTGLLEDYKKLSSDAVAYVTFHKARGRKTGSGSNGLHGIPSDDRKQAVADEIHTIDPDCEVTFNGRRVHITAVSGKSWDYDIWGQSYMNTLAEELPKA